MITIGALTYRHDRDNRDGKVKSLEPKFKQTIEKGSASQGYFNSIALNQGDFEGSITCNMVRAWTWLQVSYPRIHESYFRP